MALDRTQANSILSYLHKASGAAAPRTITGPIMVRLIATAGSAAANGTPISGVHGSTGVSAGAWTNTAASQSDANSADINFTSMPATTVNAVELWSSDGTPVRTEFGNLTTPRTTSSGDTLTIAAGQLTSALA